MILVASDYEAIREDNKRRYGTDIARIGPMLLANRYADRAHFIFELLQNAEDALGRRTVWNGSAAVSFHLSVGALRISHFGNPFDASNVSGICGIAQSTKDLTAIGRFGIGFKSVYEFTDRPEVHSGTEDFAIESFVWPSAVPPIERNTDETVILMPLKALDPSGRQEISEGLGRLGPSALLFLRHIKEIDWKVDGGASGLYLRESIDLDPGVRRVTVVGQERGAIDIDQEWLVFSRAVKNQDGDAAGYVEIAFSSIKDETERRRIQRVERSPLVVFFPTVLETHLGFLIQGPYRTTPSRDNVPSTDSWNQHLVGETGSLLVEALHWLRDHELLDAAALRCLPLDQGKFDETTMFHALFEAVKEALGSEALLPRVEAGHVASANARLARTQDLRDLISESQLGELFRHTGELAWLSGEITNDRTPELRQYLMRELGVAEITPDAILTGLDKEFLEAQDDEWILKLYEFLNGQPALRRRAGEMPLVRLANGTHVITRLAGQPSAFLPGPIETDFPTVREAVCATASSRAFLQSLGLTEPDPVDDVVWNILPKYRLEEVDVNDADYEADIRRIMTAFGTDSKGQKEKLLSNLRETNFIMSVDAGDGAEFVSKPTGLYIATERLKKMFEGVPDVLLIDDNYACLRTDAVREMLEACGAVRYLRPVEDLSLTSEERSDLRSRAGHIETSGQNDRIADWTLAGLKGFLARLTELDVSQRGERAKLLWEELAQVEERRGKGIFSGEYTWTHYGSYRAVFEAAFVRQLNNTSWVPDANGDLQNPSFVLFDTLGWKPNPFLFSKIPFKPPLIDQLAKEAGIEPGVLDLLKKYGLTSVAELVTRLGVSEAPPSVEESNQESVETAIKDLMGDAPSPTRPALDPSAQDPVSGGNTNGGSSLGYEAGVRAGGGNVSGSQHRGATGSKNRSPGSGGARPFISYVAVNLDDEDVDPDGLDQATRMALEAKAIDFIIAREPRWQRTNTHNPGFDLVDPGERETQSRWCEVKAMTETLQDRPVGLSHTQFKYAQAHGDAFWLYIVERAGHSPRIVRIQDPAGKARTFTFDRGWLNIASLDD